MRKLRLGIGRIGILSICGLALWAVSCGEEAPPEDAGIRARVEETSQADEPRDVVLIELESNDAALENIGVSNGPVDEVEGVPILSEPTLTEELESKPFHSVIGIGGGAGGSVRNSWGARRRTAPQNPALDEDAFELPSPFEIGGLFAFAGEKRLGAFPLRRTEVEADISGSIARTVVHQTFENVFADPIEAVYVFPLPTDAAVNDFVMQIGERRIFGLIRPREEAAKIYARARSQGKTASLLTQERPNVFTQSVANVPPGEAVAVSITYFGRLDYDFRTGELEYVFPTVVGPRFTPGAPRLPREVPEDGPAGGADLPTDRVPDAHRLSPPHVPANGTTDHVLSLRATIDAGFPIDDIRSPTHEIQIEPLDARQSHVTLKEEAARLDRDFVLRFRSRGQAPQLGLVTHRSDAGGYFQLMIAPPVNPQDTEVTPREIIFVMDVSGSMKGLPLEISQKIVRRTLVKLRADDHFNIVTFAAGSRSLSPRPLANRSNEIYRALKFIESLRGGGGTQMLEGIEEYLSTEREAERLRIVCFLTDGFISNESEIFRLIRERGRDARWFSFGVGSGVNRHLIKGIAREGRGASYVVLPRDEAAGEQAVTEFLSKIDAPVWVDLELDWGGLPVEDVLPAVLPDLFTGDPIRVVGRFTKATRGTVIVRGRRGARPFSLSIPVELPESEPRHVALASLWARTRIEELETQRISRPKDQSIITRIRDLALEYRLVSRYTGFVAVQEDRIVGNGQPDRIVQPVELPEGMSEENRKR